MSESFSHLQNLVELARETSDERRRQLLQEVTNLFFGAGDVLSDAQRGLFGDVMTKIMPDVEAQARKSLAEQLAKVPNAPVEVIRSLANDAIDIARPVLTESPVLKDADLLAIIESKGQEHLLSVSQRAQVSETVSDRLVDKGDDVVVESLIKNKGAELSHQTFDKVATRAETSERLQAPLVERADAPPDVLHRVFWVVPIELRKKILSATSKLDDKDLDRLLAESEAQAARELAERLAKSEDEAEQFITGKEVFGKLNQALLIELLRQNDLLHFVAGFARLAKMDTATVRFILADRNGEAAAIACKAIGLHWAHFSNLMLLVRRGKNLAEAEHKKLVDLYNKLPEETAQRTLRFWRLRRDGAKKAGSGG